MNITMLCFIFVETNCSRVAKQKCYGRTCIKNKTIIRFFLNMNISVYFPNHDCNSIRPIIWNTVELEETLLIDLQKKFGRPLYSAVNNTIKPYM